MHQDGPAYSLPHLLNRDTGGGPFEDVLIVGAGSGNDVAAALWHGAGAVDAVEIDPSIQRIGRIDHPNRPYADRRVSAHLDDGRSFVKSTGRMYDLATYALVDSLVLHSGYSSLRLESFLFTEEAFRDIKAKLKPGGVFVMYNAFRQGWVVGRLAALAEKVFGTKPIVLSLPHVDAIEPGDNQGGRVTCLLVGLPGSPLVERVRKAFDAGNSFWLASVPEANKRPTALATGPRGLSVTTAPGRRSVRSGWRPAGWVRCRPMPGRSSTSRSRNPSAQSAGDGTRCRDLARSPRGLHRGADGATERPDVLPGRRLHAPGVQGRRSDGIALRFDLGGQCGRLRRDPVMILLGKPVRAGGAPAVAEAVLCSSGGRVGGQFLGADVRVPGLAGPVALIALMCVGLSALLLCRSDLRDGLP